MAGLFKYNFQEMNRLTGLGFRIDAFIGELVRFNGNLNLKSTKIVKIAGRCSGYELDTNVTNYSCIRSLAVKKGLSTQDHHQVKLL